MPKLIVPNDASLHTAKSFPGKSEPFADLTSPAILELHPRWAHVDPVALSIIAAWGGWCKRNEMKVAVHNLGRHANYAHRMRLFQHLGVGYSPSFVEHEEAGRFLPLTQVSNYEQLKSVIGDISALLHLDMQGIV